MRAGLVHTAAAVTRSIDSMRGPATVPQDCLKTDTPAGQRRSFDCLIATTFCLLSGFQCSLVISLHPSFHCTVISLHLHHEKDAASIVPRVSSDDLFRHCILQCAAWQRLPHATCLMLLRAVPACRLHGCVLICAL